MKFLLILALFLSVSSCLKYDEGRNFALRPLGSRLNGEWKLVKYVVEGQDRTGDIDFTLKFKKKHLSTFDIVTYPGFENGYKSVYVEDNCLDGPDTTVWGQYHYRRNDPDLGARIDIPNLNNALEIYELRKEILTIRKPKKLIDDGSGEYTCEEYFYFEKVK